MSTLGPSRPKSNNRQVDDRDVLIASGTLASSTASLSFSGLDGDSDLSYYLEMWGTYSGLSAEGLVMSINGGGTIPMLGTFSGGAAASLAVAWHLRPFISRVEMPVASVGSHRHVIAESQGTSAATTSQWSQGGGTYENSATKITSFAFAWTNAGVFVSGFKYILKRRPAARRAGD